MKKLTHDYGFLQSLLSSDIVYFNTAHVMQTGQGERLRVGSQVKTSTSNVVLVVHLDTLTVRGNLVLPLPRPASLQRLVL